MPVVKDKPGPRDLFDLAREFLDACKHAVEFSPGGPIERAYVSPGPPPFDCCDQLTVHVIGPAQSDTSPLSPTLAPGQRINVQGYVNLVTLAATVLRCVPVIEGTVLPTIEALEDSAANTIGDVWAMWNHVRSAVRNGILFSYPDTRREVEMTPPTPVPIEGGAGGWVFMVRVRLDGYDENETHA